MQLTAEARGGAARSRRLVEFSSVLALFLLAAAPHLPVRDQPINGIDGLPSVAAARVDSWRELPGLLTRELRGGRQAGGYYYRPATTLSFALDHALWGWDAAGFHLTDLALAGLAAVAVYALARVAFARGVWFAGAVAALFALHPSSIEVVPVVARRQEPLLVIGICLALIGASRLPSRRGLWLHLAGCVVAVTSVERGLVVPAVVAPYLFLCRFGSAPFADRLRRAALWSLPSLAVAVAFFALRTLLYGPGGIVFVPENLARLPSLLALWVVYPQQLIDLRVPSSVAGLVLANGALLALVAGAVLVLQRSRERALLAFAAAWLAAYSLLISVAGQIHPWYAYSAVPPFALATIALAAQGLRGLRERAKDARAALSLGLAVLFVGASLVASPAWTDYPAWRVVNAMSERFLGELRRLAASAPPDATLVVLNAPGAFRESQADWRVTQSAAGLWPRSVRTWRELNAIPRQFVFVGVANFVEQASVPRIELRDGGLEVWFERGDSEYINPDAETEVLAVIDPPVGRGLRFRWPPARVSGEPRLYVFDGRRLNPVE